MSKFDSGDIIKKFKELEADINKLWCFVEECCAKIPINIGSGVGLFKRLYRNKWEFKSVVAGSNVTITEQDDTITINSTATPFTCNDVNECLGISEAGAVNKYLNEQGNFIEIGGGGFTCNDLNSCDTDNLPEGVTNLYFTNTRAINALAGTPTYVNYYSPSTGLITGDQYFTRLITGRTRIWGDIAGQDGGYLDLNPIGVSYFGANNAGSLDNYFWVSGSNLGWAWNSLEFILPTTDGNAGDVLTTNGAGILSFQPPSGGGLITAIADTNTVDLVDTAGTLTANVRHQDTTTINLSDDASGLKADFASMNISQFTNDSGYTTNTGTVTSVSALTLGTTGTDLSSTVANSTTTPVITLNVPTASASNRGALSSTDWSTFNSKEPAITWAQGDLLYGTGVNTYTKLSKDTNATRYLSNTGTSNNPAWAQVDLTDGVTGILPGANGGSLVLLSTATASSSSSIDFEVDYTVYKKYIIEFTDVRSSVNYTDDLWLRVGTGSPVAYQSGASDYSWVRQNVGIASSGTGSTSTAGTYSDTKVIIAPFLNNTGVYSVDGRIEIFNPSGATFHKNIMWHSTIRLITVNAIIGTYYHPGSATYRSSTAITGLRIMSSTGNILTGTFKLYGVA